jgi:hypothetical protein
MSNIDKDRRNRSGTGYKTTGAGSFGTINVSSLFTATAFGGGATWRGITSIASGDSTVTVSATQISSGYVLATGLGASDVGSHRDLVTSVDSVVDGVSMSVVVQNATVDSQEVWYIVIQ